MTTDDLVNCLRSWVETLPKMRGEPELHKAISQKLAAMELRYLNNPPIANPGTGGTNHPDFLVAGVDPQLIIEVKAHGDWRHAAEAGSHLFQAAELLKGTNARKLAIFGDKITDPIMLKMFKALGIEAMCVQA